MSAYLKKMRKSSNINSCILVLWTVLIYAFAFAIKPFTELFISSSNANFDYAQKLFMFLFQYIIAVPVSIFAFRRFNDTPKLKSCFCKPKMPAKWVFKWIIISLALVYITTYASAGFFSVLQQITGVELHPIDMTADNNTLSRLTNIIAMMFLAPFFEEILFRGTLLRSGAKHGTWSMIVAMGIMFGLWHENYEQTFYTAALGICAGFLVIKTESIIPSILLHFCMNTLGTISSLFVGNIDMEKLRTGDDEYVMSNLVPIMSMTITGLIIFAIMITGIVLFILEIIRHKDSFKLKSINTEISEVKKTAIYFTAPMTIIVTLVFVVVTIKNAIR